MFQILTFDLINTVITKKKETIMIYNNMIYKNKIIYNNMIYKINFASI